MPFTTKPSSCEGCPAYLTGKGFVEPSGKQEARWILLGHGPDEVEARVGRAFTEETAAGHRMHKWLRRAGYQLADVMLSHTVLCWLPGTLRPTPRGQRDPTQAELQHCWKVHLEPLLRGMPKTHIVPVGAAAARWFLGKETVQKYFGTTQILELPNPTTQNSVQHSKKRGNL